MGLIKILRRQAGFPRRILLFCAFLFFFDCFSGFAQEAGTPLASEIRAIESVVNAPEPGNPPESGAGARHEALIRLARLRQLLGDMEAAAASWIDAAAAGQGSRRESALVSGAFCMAAMGEWERAAALIAPVLRENRQGPALRRARYLEACARAWTGGGASGLIALAQTPEYTDLHSSIYYPLWRLGGLGPELPDAGSAAAWRARLLEEFPHSPEGRIATSESAGQPQANAPAVGAKASLHWLLIPGFEAPVEMPRPIAQAAPPAPAAPSAQAVPVAPPPQSSSPAQSASPAQTGRVLQTGLFGVESNAVNQKEKLIKAGFSAAIICRTVNGTEYWAVTVPGGSNMNRTIEDLKKAGFDSFPL